MLGMAATVSRNIARFRTFFSVKVPHLKNVKLSNTNLQSPTAAKAV